jgi:hypothetical protein
MRKTIAVIGIALAATTAHAGESLRCGRWLVDESATVEELLKKCGEPASKTVTESDARAIGPTGYMIKVGTVKTEEWTYDRGRQAAPIVVTIVDGKLRSMHRAER